MNRFKTYAFWLALSSSIVILVQSIGKLFNFEIESSTIENIIMSICGVLVVLGIVTKDPGSENKKESSEKNTDQSIEKVTSCDNYDRKCDNSNVQNHEITRRDME